MEVKKTKKFIVDVMNGTGEIIVEAEGYTGQMCKEESKFIEEALGKTVETTLKPCYFVKEGDKVKEGRTYKPICG